MATVTPVRRTGRRPNFPLDFKRRVVEATFQPGASVSVIAREHDVNANLVFRWRQQYQEGLFGPVSQSAALLPVQIIETPMDLAQVVQPPAERYFEIAVEVGEAKLRVTGAPGPHTLQLVLQQLLQ
ncbi:IS66-like element accessory protein TnpA [Pseudomonas sp. NR3]|uniref:IS66-like element accessory protein TnpA n=1 Tax=Pseudomonas sp. NR3 TaxID=3155978 RepID=UPI003B66FC73